MDAHDSRWRPKSIWLLALVYGGSYAAFLLALRHALIGSSDALPLLFGFSIGALLPLPLAICFLRKRAERLGLAQGQSLSGFWSGASAAVIALATAMAFSFDDLSVLTALLFMRGGVLILSPLIDWWSGRRVADRSWIALSLSLAAVTLLLWGLDGIVFSPALAATLVVYLCGYGLRLSVMTRRAKRMTAGLRAAYLAQELIWTAAILGVVALSIAFANVVSIREVAAFVPAGLAYACALLAGSLIYLDARENSFTIPVNRGASLLAGLAVSITLAATGLGNWPKIVDLGAAGLILLALCYLGFTPEWPRKSGRRLHSRFFQRRRSSLPYGRGGQ